MIYRTGSQQETQTLAGRLAPVFLAKKEKNNGLVVCLDGEMGCGKTVFVRGVLRALDYPGEVTSPTFSLCHFYEADVPVYHLDLYRLSGDDDLFSAGVFDVCTQDALVFVEWAENAEEPFPGSLRLRFSYGEKENERIIEIEDL